MLRQQLTPSRLPSFSRFSRLAVEPAPEPFALGRGRFLQLLKHVLVIVVPRPHCIQISSNSQMVGNTSVVRLRKEVIRPVTAGSRI